MLGPNPQLSRGNAVQLKWTRRSKTVQNLTELKVENFKVLEDTVRRIPRYA